MKPGLAYLERNAINWLLISAPTRAWADKVFPNTPAELREERLWRTIFTACRADRPDPVAAWQEHIRRLAQRRDYLNHKRYAELRYSAPGTDLAIGLPDGHTWASGSSVSERGVEFTPNLPTEEVWTLPHRARVNGVVAASRPLNYYGTLIDGFRLTFAEGRAVEATAAKGQDTLRQLIATDEGAARLGEIALVSNDSPIARSGILFYNTLFDENAASHVALGAAYRFNLAGGEQMSTEQFMQAGGNYSLIHVDFMIGSDRMDIDGIRADGTIEPIMRQGEWAFQL
jgi:aminopeptidase